MSARVRTIDHSCHPQTAALARVSVHLHEPTRLFYGPYQRLLPSIANHTVQSYISMYWDKEETRPKDALQHALVDCDTFCTPAI